MKKLMLLVGAALVFAACSESPTAPRTKAPSARANDGGDGGITCLSGYVIAYDENGNPYCAPEGP